MPELPDVEAFRRVVERTCLGRVIARAVVLDPRSLEGISAATFQRRLKLAISTDAHRPEELGFMRSILWHAWHRGPQDLGLSRVLKSFEELARTVGGDPFVFYARSARWRSAWPAAPNQSLSRLMRGCGGRWLPE